MASWTLTDGKVWFVRFVALNEESARKAKARVARVTGGRLYWTESENVKGFPEVDDETFEREVIPLINDSWN